MVGKSKNFKRVLAFLLSLTMILSLGDFGLMGPITAKADPAEDSVLKMSGWVNWWVDYDGVNFFMRESPVVEEGNDGEANCSFSEEQVFPCWSNRKVAFALFEDEVTRRAVSENTTFFLYRSDDKFEEKVAIPAWENDLDTRLEVPAYELEALEYFSPSDTYGVLYLKDPGNYLIETVSDSEQENGRQIKVHAFVPLAGYFTKAEFDQQYYIPNYNGTMINDKQPVYFLYDKTYARGINTNKAPFIVNNEENGKEEFFADSPHGLKMEPISESECPEGYGGYKIYVDDDTVPNPFWEKIRLELSIRTDLNDEQQEFVNLNDGEYRIDLNNRPTQMFSMNWARDEWDGDNESLFYDNDDFQTDTGIDAWSQNVISLAIVDTEGKRKPYTGKIKVTEAVKEGDTFVDTQVLADPDSYELNVIDDKNKSFSAIKEECSDVTYAEIKLKREAIYCLTAEDQTEGSNKVFFEATRPVSAFYKEDSISGENYIQDWDDQYPLSTDQGFYLIIDKTLDDNRTVTVDGLAKWNDDEQCDVLLNEKDYEEVYPYLDYKVVKDDEKITILSFKGNEQNVEECFDDVKVMLTYHYRDQDYEEKRVHGLRVQYPVKGFTITPPWDDRAFKKMECWVFDGKDDFRICQDTEEFFGEVEIRYEGVGKTETTKEKVIDGRLRTAFNKIGTYTITKDGSAEDTIVVEAVRRPIDFFEQMDFSKRAGGRNVTKKGQDRKLYLFIDNGFTEMIDGEEDHLILDRIEVRGWLEDRSEVYLEPDAEIEKQDEDGTWMSFVLPSTYSFEGEDEAYGFDSYDIQAYARSKSYHYQDYNLNLMAIEDGHKMIRVENQDLDNVIQGECVDYVDLQIYPFGAWLKFTPVQMNYDEQKNTFTAEKIKDFNPDNLKFGYWQETDQKDDEGRTIYEFIEKGVDYQANNDGSVEATFHMEGRFDILYNDGKNDDFMSGVYPHQPEIDYYETDARPGEYEEVKLYTDEVKVKEKQGAESDTFYVFWKAYTKADEENFTKASGYKGPMNHDLAAEVLQDGGFGWEDDWNFMANHIDYYLTCMDPDSFEVHLETDDGNRIEGEEVLSYLTITDIKDNGSVVGKKMEVKKEIPQGFYVVSAIKYNGYGVFRKLFECDEYDHIIWDEDNDFYQMKQNFSFNGAATDVLNDKGWTSDPGQMREVSYRIEYDPFVSLKLDKTPAMTAYTEGDTLSVSGLSVSGVYADKTSCALTASDYTINLTDRLKPTDTKVVITYKDNPKLKCEYAITVAKKENIVPVKPQPETNPPAALGDTVTPANATGGAKATFKVTQAATASGNGKVVFTGVAQGDTATELTILDKIVAADGNTYEVVEIAAGALEGNKNIKKVTVGDGIKTIGENAFKGMAALESVTLGNGVETLKKNCFANNKKLKTFKGGASLKSIEAGVFSGCTALKTVDLSKSPIKSLGKNWLKGAKPATIKINANNLKKVGKKLAGFTKKNKIILYVKDDKLYKNVVNLFKKAGAKKAKYTKKKAKK